MNAEGVTMRKVNFPKVKCHVGQSQTVWKCKVRRQLMISRQVIHKIIMKKKKIPTEHKEGDRLHYPESEHLLTMQHAVKRYLLSDGCHAAYPKCV